MICAEDELGLGESHEGIMVLDEKLTPGTPVPSFSTSNKTVPLKLALRLTVAMP